MGDILTKNTLPPWGASSNPSAFYPSRIRLSTKFPFPPLSLRARFFPGAATSLPALPFVPIIPPRFSGGIGISPEFAVFFPLSPCFLLDCSTTRLLDYFPPSSLLDYSSSHLLDYFVKRFASDAVARARWVGSEEISFREDRTRLDLQDVCPNVPRNAPSWPFAFFVVKILFILFIPVKPPPLIIHPVYPVYPCAFLLVYLSTQLLDYCPLLPLGTNSTGCLAWRYRYFHQIPPKSSPTRCHSRENGNPAFSSSHCGTLVLPPR